MNILNLEVPIGHVKIDLKRHSEIKSFFKIGFEFFILFLRTRSFKPLETNNLSSPQFTLEDGWNMHNQ
jgi:hypothetical protein